MDEAAVRKALVRHWQYVGRDEDVVHELYHDMRSSTSRNRVSGSSANRTS